MVVVLCGCASEEDTPLEIEVTGENRRWTARYPGQDGLLHTSDDTITPGEIIIPPDVPITLHLKSKDFLYLFSLPHLSLSEIAVPGLEYQLAFITDTEGDFEMIGGQMCGSKNTNHGTFRCRKP